MDDGNSLIGWILTGVSAVVIGILTGLKVLWGKTEKYAKDNEVRLANAEKKLEECEQDRSVLKAEVAGLQAWQKMEDKRRELDELRRRNTDEGK